MGNEHPAPAVTRKTFLDWLMSRSLTTWLLGSGAGGLVAAVLYPVTRYLKPPDVSESAVSSVTLPFGVDEVARNSGQIFRMGNQAGLLVRTPAGELRAFTARCTHLDCIVQYRDDLSHIWCACHNGHYDLTGRNISGPPPRPLPAFDVSVRGTQIVVSRPT
jgi:Rieske Fe-S protein